MSSPAPITEAKAELQRSNPGEPGGLPNEAGVMGREFLVHEGDKVVPKIVTKDVIVEVPQVQINEVIIEQKKIIEQEKVVEVKGPEQIIEIVKELCKPVFVEKIIEVPDIKYNYYDVERVVEIPEYQYEYVTRDVEVPVQVPRYREVEKSVEVPMVQYVEREVVNPFVNYHVREKQCPVPVPQYRQVQVEKWQDEEVDEAMASPNAVELRVPVPDLRGPTNFVGSITARVNHREIGQIPMSSQMAYELNIKAQSNIHGRMTGYFQQFEEHNREVLATQMVAANMQVNVEQQAEFNRLQMEAFRQLHTIQDQIQQARSNLVPNPYGGTSSVVATGGGAVSGAVNAPLNKNLNESYVVHEPFFAPIAGGSDAINMAQRGTTFQIGQNLQGNIGTQVGEAYPLSEAQIDQLKRQYGVSEETSRPVLPGADYGNHRYGVRPVSGAAMSGGFSSFSRPSPGSPLYAN
eukprot:TRINITY_DN34107_c0_g1_i1.p1 TRINITY_DN34107_c0_g1~~TRINITY_DN34107_c0_g1_i1.p1  ORF type:complete len:462 (-),score=47.26 TRINITY_DN34107_c0_g1_i1:202-1587(-)